MSAEAIIMWIIGLLKKPFQVWINCREFKGKGIELHGRYFVWDGEGPIHKLYERSPVQLLDFYKQLCDEIKRRGDMPLFLLVEDPREIPVFETDRKRTWKRKLLGGHGGEPGNQYLYIRRKHND